MKEKKIDKDNSKKTKIKNHKKPCGETL